MRFQLEPYPEPGDTRIRSFFAFLPISIGMEGRWLEKVTILERFQQTSTPYELEWTPVRFVDDTEQASNPQHGVVGKP